MAAVLAVGAATATGVPTASAQGASGDPAANLAPAARTRAQSTTLDGVGPGPHSVTLVTGDRVTLTQQVGGLGVDVTPASRPDRVTPLFLQQSDPDGLYVLPSDALAAVQAGRVDRELFNVKYLVENGYADDETARVPVIVQYPTERSATATRSAAAALPASTSTMALTSVHGAAVDVAKKQAGQFWASLTPPAVTAAGARLTGLGAGVSRVWLDRISHVTLDVSVPLIGAPQAWAAGHDGTGVTVAVLDTGVDQTHPDLAGKVVQSRSFIDGVSTVADGHGHGTHVATTIAGSGAASGGKYRGVAPGASLMIGKVCDDSGSCPDSAMLAGMQWAAESGAKIISLSVGGEPTDGTDILSQAVNDLSASTGTLFVIAAGNFGPATETVSTPGTATSALTVAATDKSDRLASFSSRGPRLDGALKPDIAAPGVNIVAGRAAGTAMGSVVDDHYTSASGTSMATPHVSGAVAILAQEHPDWTGPELKAALMSTSTTVAGTVYEVGAGRVNVARAHDQQVVATTANADFGLVPEDAAPSSRQVTYRNSSDQPVTLTLQATLSGSGGAADNALGLDASTVTVPAGGTATATLTLDASGLSLGAYSGALTATADGVSLSTPVAADREKPRRRLIVHTIGPDGKPFTPSAQSTIDVTGDRGRFSQTTLLDANTTVTMVPEGTLSVTQWIVWVDADSRANLAYLINPEVTVDGDTEVTLDARTASQVTFDTPQPAQPLNNWFKAYTQRINTAGDHFADEMYFPHPIGSWGKVWATRTDPVTKGSFRFATQWMLGKSEVDLSTVVPQSSPLHTVTPQHWEQTQTGTPDVDGHPDFRFFTGTQNLPVVDVGLGRPEDIAGVDLRGKLALLRVDVCAVAIETIGPLRDAGAAGLVVYPSATSGCPVPLQISQIPRTGPAKPIGVPFTFLSSREGTAVHDQLGAGPVTLQVTGTPETPYTYSLKPYEDGRVPESLHYRFGDKDLAQVDLDIHAPTQTRMSEYQYIWKTDDAGPMTAVGLSINGMAFTAPRTRRDWVGPLAPDVIHNRTIASTTAATSHRVEVFDRPVKIRQQWMSGPVTPGADLRSDKLRALVGPGSNMEKFGLDALCTLCRENNRFWPQFEMTTGVGDAQSDSGVGNILDFRFQLDKDGVPVDELFPGTPFLGYPMDDSPGTYHLTASSLDSSIRLPQTNVRWTFEARPAEGDNWLPGQRCLIYLLPFTSGRCQPQSAPYVGFDMDDSLAIDNTVPAGRKHTFTVSAYHSQSLGTMPRIAGVRVWVSTDDGKHWDQVSMRSNKDGTYTATAQYPKYAATTGAVSLRAEAWDVEGNRVEQTTMHAFGLRDLAAHHPTNAQ